MRMAEGNEQSFTVHSSGGAYADGNGNTGGGDFVTGPKLDFVNYGFCSVSNLYKIEIIKGIDKLHF
jgi:hypothetical protein